MQKSSASYETLRKKTDVVITKAGKGAVSLHQKLSDNANEEIIQDI